MKKIHGTGKTFSLICRHGEIVVSKQIVEWYNNVLCHPGETRTKLTIGQHFYWKSLQKSAHDIYFKCHKKHNHGISYALTLLEDTK